MFAACAALSSTFRPVSCPAISRTADKNAALFVWNWSDDTVTAPKCEQVKTRRHCNAHWQQSMSEYAIGAYAAAMNMGCCGNIGDAHIAK